MAERKPRFIPPPVQPPPGAAADRVAADPTDSPSSPPNDAPPSLDAGGFRLEAACEECGAPVFFGEEDRSSTCRYCGSLLILWPDDGAIPAFYLPTRLDDPERMRSLLASYHAMKLRPELASRYRDPNGQMLVPAAVLDDEIRRHEQRFLATLAIQSLDKVYAPYRMQLGELGQAFVGRDPTGLKDVSFRVYAIELTQRGYSTDVVNLRDRGLRLSLGRLKLLTSKERATLGGRFLHPVPPDAGILASAGGLVPKAQDHRLDTTTPPLGRLLFARDCLMYKPFLWVSYIHDGRSLTILVDGATEQVAGIPHPGESERFLASESFAQPPAEAGDHCVHVFASECPVCGHEQVIDGRSRLQLCTVCNRALELRGDGIIARDYVYAPNDEWERVLWVPFWRFPFQLEAADGRCFTSLAAVHEEIFRGMPPPADAGETIAIPAVRCLGHASLDDAFSRLTWMATYWPLGRRIEGPLNPDCEVTSVAVTLDEREAGEVAPLVLYTLLDKARRARINVPKIKNLLSESRLHLPDAQLEFIPLPLSEDVIKLGDHAIRKAVLLSTPSELQLVQRIRVPV